MCSNLIARLFDFYAAFRPPVRSPSASFSMSHWIRLVVSWVAFYFAQIKSTISMFCSINARPFASEFIYSYQIQFFMCVSHLVEPIKRIVKFFFYTHTNSRDGEMEKNERWVWERQQKNEGIGEQRTEWTTARLGEWVKKYNNIRTGSKKYFHCYHQLQFQRM